MNGRRVMSDVKEGRGAAGGLMRGLNASVTGHAQAFGISITVTYGAVNAAQGTTRWELLGFAIGATVLVSGWPVWLLAPLLSALVYILLQSVELAVGRDETDQR